MSHEPPRSFDELRETAHRLGQERGRARLCVAAAEDACALEAAFDALRSKRIVQRIIKRAQIWVDLIAHVARQKTKSLARLYGRSREDQAFAETALQRCCGKCDSQVCLTCTGGPCSENEVGILEAGGTYVPVDARY